MIDLSFPNHYVTLTLQEGDGGVTPGVDQERGYNVLDQPQGHIFPDSNSLRLLVIVQNCHGRQSLPGQDALLQPFHSSPGLHHSIFSGVRIDSKVRDSSSLVSQQLANRRR